MRIFDASTTTRCSEKPVLLMLIFLRATFSNAAIGEEEAESLFLAAFHIIILVCFCASSIPVSCQPVITNGRASCFHSSSLSKFFSFFSSSHQQSQPASLSVPASHKNSRQLSARAKNDGWASSSSFFAFKSTCTRSPAVRTYSSYRRKSSRSCVQSSWFDRHNHKPFHHHHGNEAH